MAHDPFTAGGEPVEVRRSIARPSGRPGRVATSGHPNATIVGEDRVVVAGVVLAGLVLAAGLSGRYGMAGAVTLAAISVAWLVVNGPMEGPVLVVVARGHGLTGGDLAGLAGLGLAMFQGTRAHRARQTT